MGVQESLRPYEHHEMLQTCPRSQACMLPILPLCSLRLPAFSQPRLAGWWRLAATSRNYKLLSTLLRALRGTMKSQRPHACGGVLARHCGVSTTSFLSTDFVNNVPECSGAVCLQLQEVRKHIC